MEGDLEKGLLEQAHSEVVARVATEMRKHELRRALFAYLITNSGRKRLDDVHTGRGVGRVNLPGALKRFVKNNFPDYIFQSQDSEEHHFQKKISDEVAFALDFERVHHFGMGKTYAVWLGIKHPDASWTRLRHNLLEFFDRTRMEWCYGTTDEL